MNSTKTGKNDDRELTLAELDAVSGGDPSTGVTYADGGSYVGGGTGGSAGGGGGWLRRIIERIRGA
jgi:hypothetical protein